MTRGAKTFPAASGPRPPGACVIHTWSRESTATLVTGPSDQLFGNGFGQLGSGSYEGMSAGRCFAPAVRKAASIMLVSCAAKPLMRMGERLGFTAGAPGHKRSDERRE